MTLGDLADHEQVAPPSVTRVVAKLEAAEAAGERGDDAGRDGSLVVFANQVAAKTGKLLTVAEADELLRRVDIYRG